MLRRNARLRKEYLYRKSLEGKEKEQYEKKRLIRQALAGGCAAFCSWLFVGRLGPGRRDLRGPSIVDGMQA